MQYKKFYLRKSFFLLKGIVSLKKVMRRFFSTTKRILSAGAELHSSHPGFHDLVYRKRREEIVDIAINYKPGTLIPRVSYTEEETKVWQDVYIHLLSVFRKHACKEYNEGIRKLHHFGLFNSYQVPQLQSLSDFLQQTSGFKLQPIPGLLHPRYFFAALSDRIFPCTQYIRHHSKPFYTPEPDLLHECLGHVPLLSNESFAEVSQLFGTASIHATDEELEQLARLYWFTIEFGLCKEQGTPKIFGAGILSSVEESLHAVSDESKRQSIDVPTIMKRSYPMTTLQQNYFIGESFDEVLHILKSILHNKKRFFHLCNEIST